MPTKKRSIAKTVTFRIIATISTMFLVWIFTDSISLAGAIGGIDLLVKTILYYFHERAWSRVVWGRE
ncbi:DUF2061 domain-containing protein [Patescibacteria group bacterium]|nr:DUF2061 domain-containing protein [Patescibacteria group bacterium]MBU4458294.1 DUF2061 domain-containing protein [Patescibacteria group bacterium]MCG2696209.1 DUF2061 domain-containing protein [Candidatus Portnoybacteria bacterium]